MPPGDIAAAGSAIAPADEKVAEINHPHRSSYLLRNWLAWRMRLVSQPERQENPLQVFVRDNNVDQALRVLKKKMQREGVFREMRRRRFYEKPSEEAARRKSDAVRRMRKLARKQAIRDGLIAAPPKKKKEDARPRPGVAAGAT